MIVLCNIYKPDIDLVPHFLEHYSRYGIRRFAIGICDGKSNPMWDYLDRFKDLEIIKHPFQYGGGFDVPKDTQVSNDLRLAYVGETEWYLPTDLDEFHYFPGVKTFQEVQEMATAADTDYVEGHFTDRITIDGTFPLHIDPNVSIWHQFPKSCYVTKTIMGSGCDKIIMARQPKEIITGHHVCRGKRFSKRGATFHFKWWGNLYRKEQKKLLQYRDVKKYHFHLEWVRLLKHLDENGGKFTNDTAILVGDKGNSETDGYMGDHID
jgi:hypothetical protein